MKNETKILIAVCIALVLFVGGLCTGLAVRKAIDNKSIREYRSTIDNLRSKLIEQAENYYRIKESNKRLEELNAEISGRVENAERVIDEIRAGLSGDISTVQRIREAIRSVIQAIGKLGAPE